MDTNIYLKMSSMGLKLNNDFLPKAEVSPQQWNRFKFIGGIGSLNASNNYGGAGVGITGRKQSQELGADIGSDS